MTISARRVVAVFLFVFAGIALLGLGSAAAQSGVPAPTPAFDGTTPSSSIPVPIDKSPIPQPAGGTIPLSPSAGDKDDRRVITNGKALKGKISPSSDVDPYFFYATQGQQVTIKMTGKGSSLDGYMDLYSVRDDSWLISDDDSGGNGNPLINQFTLPRSGKYKIVLTSWNGASSGSYSLSLTVIGGDADDNRLMTPGKKLSGKIIPANDVDSYFFQAEEGQKATLQMSKKGGSLDSYLELYDPDNVLLISNDDDGGSTNALINEFSLTESGTYRVVAKSYAGYSSGAYTVRLDLSQPNLALNKSSDAWNWHAPWYLPEYGNDGDEFSRWAGDDGTNWWWVDLGSRLTFSQVKIDWETAYATEYFVGWSDAPNCLGVYEGFNYTANSAGWKTHNLGKRTARCVGIRMDSVAWPFTNYSFWELEVYNLVSNSAPALDAQWLNSVLVDAVPQPDFGEEKLIQVELTGSGTQP